MDNIWALEGMAALQHGSNVKNVTEGRMEGGGKRTSLGLGFGALIDQTSGNDPFKSV